jgi:hypothetical protein
MSITLKPWAVALLIATFGALLGFATGQISAANSQKDVSTSSIRPLVVKDKGTAAALKKIAKQLDAISDSIGEGYLHGDVRESLDKIVKNTYWTCENVRSAIYCDQ